MNAGRAYRVSPLSIICFCVWLLLTSVQFGIVPIARHAWGYNFWQYLPNGVAGGLAVASFALCFSAVRRGIGTVAQAVAVRAAGAQRLGAVPLALAGLGLVLWTMRERHLIGDSGIFIWAAASDMHFVVPDTGSTFLLWSLYHLGTFLLPGTGGGISMVQAATCVCGPLAIVLGARAAMYLAPGWGAPATILLFSGGVARVFAGHVEVYAFVLVGAAAYLWTALMALEGRIDFWVPALVLGIGLWLHASALCLVPSLLVLPALQKGAPELLDWRRATKMIVLLALPSVMFYLCAFSAGWQQDLERAVEVVREIAGVSANPDAPHRWVRGWGGDPSHGTDYVFLSTTHLKYLVNAAHVLSSAALPILAGTLLLRPSLFLATPTARFLCVSCAPLIVYALVLRPVWGPFDWDLFSVPAFFLTALGVHLLAQAAHEPSTGSLVEEIHVWLIATSLLFVTVPFLLMARGPVRDAGPFSGIEFGLYMLRPEAPENVPIEPWL